MSDDPERTADLSDAFAEGFGTGIGYVEDEMAERVAAAEARGYDRAVANLRTVLTGHYLFEMNCDHEAKTDSPWCACCRVDLGTHPSVGEAVAAWVDHVLAEVVKENPDAR